MALEIETASLHEGECLRDAIRELGVTTGLRAVLDEAEHPLPDIAKIGVAAIGEGTEQIQRGSRLPVSLQLPTPIWNARLARELGSVDDVAAIAGQLYRSTLLHRRRPGLGELSGNPADLHHRRRCGVGQDHSHLQEHTEEVTDVVGTVFREAF